MAASGHRIDFRRLRIFAPRRPKEFVEICRNLSIERMCDEAACFSNVCASNVFSSNIWSGGGH